MNKAPITLSVLRLSYHFNQASFAPLNDVIDPLFLLTTEDIASSSKRGTRHYVRFGRDEPLHEQSGSDADKRAHYVRFGRADAGDSDDRLNEADKRPNYVRFG